MRGSWKRKKPRTGGFEFGRAEAILLKCEEAIVPYRPLDLLQKNSPTLPSETVEKDDFGSLVLLRDHNFVVCPIW